MPDWVFWAVGGFVTLCLLAAGVISIIRIVRGPTLVDRLVASDMLASVMIAGFVADMVLRHHLDTIVIVLVVASVMFVGSAMVARSIGRRKSVRGGELR